MRLTLQQVRKVVNGETHLYGIDLDLEPGSFSVLLGPTQSGKTSLLRLLAGLDRPTSGAILEDGVDVTKLDVRRRNVAMVYQEFVNYPSFTVYDNIAAPLRRARRLSAAEVDAKVKTTAEMLRIERLLDRLPAELSGGQTGVLDAGRLLQYGPGLEVYHRPATVRVSEVFSDPPINLVRASIGPDGCRLSPSVAFPLADHMRSLPPGDYRVGLRANQIEVVYRSGNTGLVSATVKLAEINGSETYVHARHHDFTMIAQLEGVRQFALGESVSLHFDSNRLFVFDGAGNLAAAPARSTDNAGAS